MSGSQSGSAEASVEREGSGDESSGNSGQREGRRESLEDVNAGTQRLLRGANFPLDLEKSL